MSKSMQGRHGPLETRLAQSRLVLESLLESLDATVRISRLAVGENPTEPLVGMAASLIDRLGVASRMASARIFGPPAFVTSSQAIHSAVRDLEAALVRYRQQLPVSPVDAANALDAEIGRVKLDAERWE